MTLPLAPHELETLQIMARKGSMKAVSNQRGVTVHSVSSTLKRIYIKLGVHTSTEAAYLLGLSEQPSRQAIEKCLTEALATLRN